MKPFFATLIALIAFTTLSIAQPSWQQRVDTRIDVTLDDNNHILRAYEEITYTNNSPDTLRYIYMHLWPNAYKNDHTPYERQQETNRSRTFYYSKAADKGYIDSLQFNIDGIAADNYSSDNAPDITRIDLANPLLPGKTIKITTPFRVKLPKVFSRMGHTKQSYYISQWFPKPAVYDHLGWHPISYLDQGEFYSEYGSYKVSITLPANYVVMATGNCIDAKENKWMDELAAKPLVKLFLKGKKYPNTGMMGDTAYVYDKKTKIDSIPKSAVEMKTLHFEEDNIHDFAWFADKRWIVRKDTVVSPGNNLLVTAWAAFMPSNIKYWSKATDHLKETVKHYGKWVGPYQYKTIKAVSGDLRAGGGMEYPTVTIIDKYQQSGLRLVVIHEAGHNWFYGMLGSNERDHAWMDEGLNTFYEQKTSKALDTGKKKKKAELDEALVYFQRAATGGDQAIEQTSTKFEKLNYGLDVYYKTAYSLGWLEGYIGKEDFEAGMHDYFDTWHFHHPYPEDFKKCMQRHTSKSIDWFFDPMLTSDKKVDFKITGAKVKDGQTEVTVKNKTKLNTPVQVSVYQKDSVIESAWSQPFERTTTLTLTNTDWKRLKIADVVPDAKTTNDLYRRGSPFHTFGLKIKPFVGLNRENKDQLFVSPSVGYNQYDGWMAGGLLHDLTLPENRFKFVVAPMYSFQTQSFVGAGSIGYAWYPRGLFQEIMLQTDAKTFHYNEIFRAGDSSHLFARYTKIAPSITFTFNEHNMLSPVTNTLTLKGYYIDEEYFDTTTFAATIIPRASAYPIIRSKHNNYGSVTFSHHNWRLYNPFGYSIGGHMSEDFAKINISAYIRIDYNKSGKYLLVNGYFGKFFAINNTAEVNSRYALSANNSAANDYLYDGTYIGRNAQRGIAARQIGTGEGFFKVPAHGMVARSSNWMGAINMKSSIPIKRLPIYVFLDAGLMPNANPTFKNSRSTILLYDAGLAMDIRVLGLGAAIYVPIIMSSDFDNYLTNTYGRKNVFARSISFNIYLWNNWLKSPSTLLSVAGG